MLPPGQTMGRGDGGELHHDQHGVHRHFTDLEQGSGPGQGQGQRPFQGQELGQGQENLLLPPSQRNNNNNHLRGNQPFKEDGNPLNPSSADGEEEAVPITVVLNPRSFSIEGRGVNGWMTYQLCTPFL